MYSGYAGPDSEPKNLKPVYILGGAIFAAFIAVGWYVLGDDPVSEFEDLCRNMAVVKALRPVMDENRVVGEADKGATSRRVLYQMH